MEKVKLPKEVAEAIEKVWKEHGDLHIKHFTLTNWSYLHKDYPIGAKVLQTYAESHPIEYMTALVNGYEVEETPEDKVRGRYEGAVKEKKFHEEKEQTETAEYWSGYHSGIYDCLNDLNIKIEGVNT